MTDVEGAVPPVHLMDADQLAAWILRDLGAPQWKVELTCDQIKDAIEEARRWYAAKKGNVRGYLVDLVPNQSEYDLPDDADLVLDVASSMVASVPFMLPHEFGWDDAIVGPAWAFQSHRYFVSDFVQRLQYLEQGRQQLDAEFEWRQEGRKLIMLPSRVLTGKAYVYYKSRVVVLEQLTERDHDLVKRYALASAKMKLGRVRSKYPDGLAGATGTVRLDGDTLLQEGKEEKANLDQEIIDSGYPMGFQVG